MHSVILSYVSYTYVAGRLMYTVFTSVLITLAGEFRGDSEKFFDKTEKDESGTCSESLFITQHVAGSLLLRGDS